MVFASGYGGSDAPIQTSLPVVEISCAFPLFHQDVDDLRNYVFAPTDDLVECLSAKKCQ